MKKLSIIALLTILTSCFSNTQNAKENQLEIIEESEYVTTMENEINTLRENIKIVPNLDSLEYIKLDSTYLFSVENVPSQILTAQIIPGIIIMTALGQYDFRIRYPAENMELIIFADINNNRHEIFKMNKKLKK